MEINFSTTSVTKPLADRLRPSSWDDFMPTAPKEIQQLPVKVWLEKNFWPNLILWGPPASGKTTFIRLLEKQTIFVTESTNATDLGTKEIKSLSEMAKQRASLSGRKTILVIDEIHRLNKAQQDLLLPDVESGVFTLLGATTETPFYEINRALISRCRVIQLSPMDNNHFKTLYSKACQLLNINQDVFLSDDDLEKVIATSGSDPRQFFSIVEWLFWSDFKSSENKKIDALLPIKTISYDKSSHEHYDTISAFIKAIRGSDSNAALLYAIKMLEAGEDPKFIFRRLIILASEDIGNANPLALGIAVNGLKAFEAIGRPEGDIILSQIICYLASSPKSNRSYMALNKAKSFWKIHQGPQVPDYLKSPPPPGTINSYQYPHDFPKFWVSQKYLPETMTLPEDFYCPSESGQEKQIKEYLSWLKR